MIRYAIAFAAALSVNLAAAAAPTEHEFLDSIKSVEQVKGKLRKLVVENRDCPSGSCWIATGYEICYYIAGLDKKLDYSISGTFKSAKPAPQLEVTQPDLRQLQLMFSQCRLHNFPRLLNTVYAPKKPVEKRINAWLEVGKP